METSDEPRSEAPHKRTWGRGRLKAFVVALLLGAMGLTWFGVRLRRAKNQQRAAIAIREAGGTVDYDFELDASGERAVGSRPPQPAWLVRLLGEDFFCDVVRAAPVTHGSLRHIERLPRLRSLSLSPLTGYQDELTDSELRHVSSCRLLEELCLRHSHVGDYGLEHLTGLSRLRDLDVQDTEVTDAGIGVLGGLNALESLDLRYNHITDAGLKHLDALHRLRWLGLFGTAVTKQGGRAFQQALPQCDVDQSSWLAL